MSRFLTPYLYNKNILEYANIVVTEANSKIRYIEDHSNDHKLSVCTQPLPLSHCGRKWCNESQGRKKNFVDFSKVDKFSNAKSTRFCKSEPRDEERIFSMGLG